MAAWDNFDASDGTALNVFGPWALGANISDLKIYGGKLRNVGSGLAWARRLISEPNVSQITIGPYTSSSMDKMPAARMSSTSQGYTVRLANASGGNWQRVTIQRDGANLKRSDLVFSFAQNQPHVLRVLVTSVGGAVTVSAFVDGQFCLQEVDNSPLTGSQSGLVILTAPGIPVEETEVDDWADYLLPRNYQSDRGAFALTGQANAFLFQRSMLADHVALAGSGIDVALTANIGIAADGGALALSNDGAALVRRFSIEADGEAAETICEAAELRASRVVQAEHAGIGALGQGADVLASLSLPADAGALATEGFHIDPVTARRVAADMNSHQVLGQAAMALAARHIAADAGDMAIAEQPAEQSAHRFLPADTAQHLAAGQDAAIGTGLRLIAESADMASSGQSADLQAGNALMLGAGHVELTGIDTPLTTSRSLAADPSALVAVGQGTEMRPGRALGADPGAIDAAAQEIEIRRYRIMGADASEHELQGDGADVHAGRLLSAGSVIATSSWQATVLSASRELAATVAEIAASPVDAAVIYIQSRVYELGADAASVEAFADAVMLQAERLLGAAGGEYARINSGAGLWRSYPLHAGAAEYDAAVSTAGMIASRMLQLDRSTMTLVAQPKRLLEVELGDTSLARLIVVYIADAPQKVMIDIGPRVTILPGPYAVYL